MTVTKTDGINEAVLSTKNAVQVHLKPQSIEVQSVDMVVELTDEEIKIIVRELKRKDIKRAMRMI